MRFDQFNNIIYQNYSYLDTDLDAQTYNPDHYLVFDSIDFVNSLDFSEYIKNIIKNIYTNGKCPPFKIKSQISENSFDIFQFEFGNILLTLKIPPKSDILNISRERLFYSIFINNRPFDVHQCITKFEHLKFTLRGLI